MLLQALASLLLTLGFSLGDQWTDRYLPLLEGERVAVFTNQTGLTGEKPSSEHIVDLLVRKGVDVTCILSPEHGFRGTADAGEKVPSGVDEKTGIPVISLYGTGNGHLDGATLAGLDMILVDIQDVGLRYYTYYISMLRLMESAADAGKKVVILDRPNPNGFLVDGPVLDMSLKSGVGALPIPVAHGMTLGELALMAQGEGWLQDGKKCDLTVIPCRGYRHSMKRKLPVAPSPNLKDMRAVWLYPSICFFEGTTVSLGRGTDFPFEVYGSPIMQDDGSGFTFTPQPMQGARHPQFEGRECRGTDLRKRPLKEIWSEGVNLEYVIDAYQRVGNSIFWRADGFFDLLIGNRWVREMIDDGYSADEIRARWQPELDEFKKIRQKYLIYK